MHFGRNAVESSALLQSGFSLPKQPVKGKRKWKHRNSVSSYSFAAVYWSALLAYTGKKMGFMLENKLVLDKRKCFLLGKVSSRIYCT